MKTASFLLTILVAAWGISTADALDFTPRQETQIIDTYPIHYLSFADGNQRIGYGPPTGWKVAGGGNKLILNDPKNGQATFTVLPTPKVTPFTAADLVTFRTFAKSLTPPDGIPSKFTESTGTHLIGNRESYTASYSYAFFGKQFSIRLTVVNLGPSWLEIVATAPTDQFEAFNTALESSYCSWHPMPK